MNETEATQVLPLEDVRPRFRLRYILACRGRFQQCRSSRSDIVSASGQTWPVRSCRSRHDRKKPHVRHPLPADPFHPCSSQRLAELGCGERKVAGGAGKEPVCLGPPRAIAVMPRSTA
jgi:hypothetical protein